LLRPKLNKKLLYFLIAAVVGSLFLPGLDYLVYLLLAFHALRGNRQAVEAYTIMVVFLLGSPLFTSGGARNLRYLVFFAGFSRMIFEILLSKKVDTKYSAPLTVLFFFFLTEMAISLLVSKIAIVSALKLTAFFIAVSGILYHFQYSSVDRQYWVNWMHTIFLFMLYGSMAFLLSGNGFETNGFGFQGVLTHPQTFGPVMAVLAGWFTWRWLEKNKNNLWSWTEFLSCWIFLYLSQSRTALLAGVGGGVLAVLCLNLFGKKIPYPKKLLLLAFLVVLGGASYWVYSPQTFSNTIVKYVVKPQNNVLRKEDELRGFAGVFQESRGELVEASLENFREYPFLGIGFGVPTQYRFGMVKGSESVMGIPVSASVEKGFLPSAILEEIGLIGLAFTLVLLITFFYPLLKRGWMWPVWLVWITLLINIGEAVFFSAGGMGFFVWVMLGFSYFCNFQAQ